MVLELGEIEKEKLDAIIQIREKLRFNSDNPVVVVTSSRQIAVGTKLEVSGKVGDQKTLHQFKAIIGKVAVRGRSKSELPQAYKKIAITSKMTNIKTYA